MEIDKFLADGLTSAPEGQPAPVGGLRGGPVVTSDSALVPPEAVLKALEAVDDPHVPVSLRRMGMISGVDVGADGAVQVRLRIPCLGCPGMGMIGDGVREAVGAVPGVTSVEVIEAWEDQWRRDMVDESARNLMHDNGIQI